MTSVAVRRGLPRHGQGRHRWHAWALFLLALVCVGARATEPPAAAVASAHPLATATGLEVLASGGNAFDAAVAVAAALAVVEPQSSGLGGGGFWLLRRASDGYRVVVDGRETAPLAARPDLFLDGQGAVRAGASIDGPLSAAIPGTAAALAHVAERYGRLPLAQTLSPAIHLARAGFPVTERYRQMAALRKEALRASPAAAAVFLDHGEVPAAGYRLVQPDLARTLERLAARGARGFYEGDVAEALVTGVRTAGGIWAAEDLSRYRVVERPPVHAEYRGVSVTSVGPPSSGGVALATMLNILSEWRLDGLDSVSRKHLVIESMRRAYRDRAAYLGDPDQVAVPVTLLTHPFYAAGLRQSIRLDRATPSADLAPAVDDAGGNHTTHFSVMDGEGNRAAVSLSINYPFGCGFMPPGTGVLLNDEMDDFSSKPGVPNAYGLVGSAANAIAPGKRPLSSMSPTFLDDGERGAILGTPGGSRIISMVLLAILDFAEGRDPVYWVSRPRYHHQFLPDRVQYEPGAFTDAEIEGLVELGHTLHPLDRTYGNMQAIAWDETESSLQAVSDPRGEGSAEVLAPRRAETEVAGRGSK